MKCFIVVALILAVANATTFKALSEIATNSLNVDLTAMYPDALTAPALVTLTYPTTYDSSAAALAVFTVVGTATFSGNNSVSSGTITFSNGGDDVTLPFDATSNLIAHTATIAGGGYPVFKNTATYSASKVVLFTDLGRSYTVTLAGLAQVTATKYSPPALTFIQILSPQTADCAVDGCGSANGLKNASALLTPGRTGQSMSLYFRPTAAAAGSVFSYTSPIGAVLGGIGGINFELTGGGSPMQTTIGDTSEGYFVATTSLDDASTIVPKNSPLPFSAQAWEPNSRATYFSESTVGQFQTSFEFSDGGADTTAPTCSLAQILPSQIQTNLTAATLTISVTCVDTGGVGVWFSGVFFRGTYSDGTQTQTTLIPVDGSTAYPIPAFIQGTVSVVGVFSIDNAGNAVVYGSCGGYPMSTMCGGGSSSASQVAVSIFALAALAIMALFA